jgi:anti-anti-sigma regulatory factor
VIAKVLELYQSGTRSLLLDLTNMPYMSSSGIVAFHNIAVLLHTGSLPYQVDGWSALHAAAEEGDEFRKEVKVFNPQPRVVHTFEISGIIQFLEIFTDFKTAIDSF